MTISCYHPFQKLCYIDPSGGGSVLLAATGPRILSLDLTNGGVLSKWPDDTPTLEEQSNGDLQGRPSSDDSPRKRRKVTSPERPEEQESPESSVSVEFVSERAKGQRRKKRKIVQSTSPSVSQIISTADGRHVIAVTAEDKCVRVFELDSLGRLKPLSERQGIHIHAQRNCAYCGIDSTILAGDKFGDVYALPLLLSSEPRAPPQAKPQLGIPKPFKPSASELTVHTKGNREALRQQQLRKVSAPKKQEPSFEHQIILGHVSTLTDLVVGIDASIGSREYILTADRDEHIRVSRGIPQAHVISNYCLGHTEFVSRLCMVSERPQFLITGGGEPSLRIYDWLKGTIVAEANLEKDLKQFVNDNGFSDRLGSHEKRAVSCVRALHVGGNVNGEEVIIVVVVLEGTPAIFTYLLYPDKAVLKPEKAYSLPANVLDMTISKDRGLMLISVDNVHSSMSTKTPRPQTLPPMIYIFDLRIKQRDAVWQYEWIEANPAEASGGDSHPGSPNDIAAKLEHTFHSEEVRHKIEFEEVVKPKALYSSLGEFLYGLENLRKKSYGEAEGDRQQVEGEERLEEDAPFINPAEQ